jgi:hypothetical protein
LRWPNSCSERGWVAKVPSFEWDCLSQLPYCEPPVWLDVAATDPTFVVV